MAIIHEGIIIAEAGWTSRLFSWNLPYVDHIFLWHFCLNTSEVSQAIASSLEAVSLWF